MNHKPNILILHTDQQRADCLGFLHPQLQTPNMDRIAEEGMTFTEAFTVSPVCMPSRISFINGLYPHNTNIWYNRGHAASLECKTIYEYLQEAGYSTVFVGKNHYYAQQSGVHSRSYASDLRAIGLSHVVCDLNGPRGTLAGSESSLTDHWKENGLLELFKDDMRDRVKDPSIVRPSSLPVDEHMDSFVGRKAVEFIRRYDSAQPLCLFVGFPGPHEPWDAPGEYAAMYDPDKTPPPVPRPEWPAGTDTPDHIKEKADFQARPTSGMSAETVRAIRANYYGKISLIDHWIGEILAACDGRGILDDLLIVFTSDHGEMLGDHHRVFKRTFHESSIRIPQILRWPGRIPAGTTSDALVENIDVISTLMEVLGVPSPDHFFGRSLWPILNRQGTAVRDSVLSEIYFGESRNTMVRTRRYKYAADERGRGFMLYDLENDPNEQKNLMPDTSREPLERDMRELLLTRLLESQFVVHDTTDPSDS